MELEEMSDETRETLNTMESMDNFALDNAQLLTDNPHLQEDFDANRALMADLRASATLKISSQNAGVSNTRSKAAILREMKSDVRRVGRTARVIKKKNPAFENKFIVRSGGMSYQDVVQTTEAFINDRNEAKNDFTKRGLDDAFFAEMQTNLDELRGKSGDQTDAKRTTVGATAENEDIIERWIPVRQDLDVSLQNILRNDPDKLAEWNSAKRIIRRKSSKETPPQTPTEG